MSSTFFPAPLPVASASQRLRCDGAATLGRKVGAGSVLTLPGLGVFLIDDLRNGGDENKSHGVNEVRLRQGRIVREGLQTILSELRLRIRVLSTNSCEYPPQSDLYVNLSRIKKRDAATRFPQNQR